ncbi:hypothetical protein SAMN02745220_04686 [Desulfopila aestuarii DSM 18488]|uniref:Uncharacterized protein n=1 Tax=Desulfopila aestuarii DSM 18488 TaxID=1121416 RepID=A0A1M7YJA2_9BACT|nr:hypothetical protein SAMN02745220_04686 [Desulfopila aestuarii DSM 18488]
MGEATFLNLLGDKFPLWKNVLTLANHHIVAYFFTIAISLTPNDDVEDQPCCITLTGSYGL